VNAGAVLLHVTASVSDNSASMQQENPYMLPVLEALFGF
jgi:hypothetical protein